MCRIWIWRCCTFSKGPDYLVIPFNDSYYLQSLNIANLLRLKGKYSVEMYTKKSKISKAFDYANGISAKNVVLVAPDEYKNNQVKIKKMDCTENKEFCLNISELSNL